MADLHLATLWGNITLMEAYIILKYSIRSHATGEHATGEHTIREQTMIGDLFAGMHTAHTIAQTLHGSSTIDE